MSVSEAFRGVVDASVDALRSLSSAMTVKDDTSAFLNALQDHRTAAHQGAAQGDRPGRRGCSSAATQQGGAEHAATTDGRSRYDHRFPVRSWIRFWLKRTAHEFEEEAKRQRELDQAVIEKGVPPSVLEACARLDLERHQRNQFPVGAFFDLIDRRSHDGQKASVEQLMMVAEIGTELF
jgi:hypothetical protein